MNQIGELQRCVLSIKKDGSKFFGNGNKAAETKNEKKKSVGAPQVKDSGVIDHGMDEDSHYDEPDDMGDGSHYDKSDDDEPDDDEPDDDEHVGF